MAIGKRDIHLVHHFVIPIKYIMRIRDDRRDGCLRKMTHGAISGVFAGATAGLLLGAYDAAQIRSMTVSQVSYFSRPAILSSTFFLHTTKLNYFDAESSICAAKICRQEYCFRNIFSDKHWHTELDDQ